MNTSTKSDQEDSNSLGKHLAGSSMPLTDNSPKDGNAELLTKVSGSEEETKAHKESKDHIKYMKSPQPQSPKEEKQPLLIKSDNMVPAAELKERIFLTDILSENAKIDADGIYSRLDNKVSVYLVQDLQQELILKVVKTEENRLPNLRKEYELAKKNWE